MKTARDVVAGNCSPSTGGHPATVGPDTATGYGLVDANKAVLLAKVRCLGPVRGPGIRSVPGPIRGGVVPREPGPVRTVQPRDPGPITPRIVPPQPGPDPGPIQPRESYGSSPSLEAASLEAQAAYQNQSGGLSNEDVKELENLIIKSELNLE
jgi:hypothetical protein